MIYSVRNISKETVLRKAKLGRPVKGIPDVWIRRSYIHNAPLDPDYVTLCEHTLIDRYPYFFKYRYNDAKKKFKQYMERRNAMCKLRYSMTVEELQETPCRSRDQEEFLENFYRYSPLVISDSAMNKVCKYIELVDFKILQTLKEKKAFDYKIYKNETVEENADIHEDVVRCYKRMLRNAHTHYTTGQKDSIDYANDLREQMSFIHSNPIVIVNHLVDYLYFEKPDSNKSLLWDAYGRQLASNSLFHSEQIPTCPVADPEGELLYLGSTYTMKEVVL